jgi:hypothetical protein
MDHETVQIDFERARNLERLHRRIDIGNSRLILADLRLVGAPSKLAFKAS